MRAASTGRICVKFYFGDFTKIYRGDPDLVEIEQKYRALYMTRTPVGARFPAPVQTGRGAHPASCSIVTGSFLGVKRPGRVVDYPSPSSAEVKE
jgi:hypothetical protein